MVWAERLFPDNCSVILGRGKRTLYGFELLRSGLSNSVCFIYIMGTGGKQTTLGAAIEMGWASEW